MSLLSRYLMDVELEILLFNRLPHSNIIIILIFISYTTAIKQIKELYEIFLVGYLICDLCTSAY